MLVSFVGLPLVLNAGSVDERPEVFVSVFNNAGVDDATVLLAEKMASRIYQEAGLSIIWKNCLAEPELKSDRCVPMLDNRHLVLHIERQARTLQAADIYGVAFLDPDGTGVYCDVFYDRIVKLHHASKASEATILGIVATHELGHLLLGSHAHAPVGIMRPQLQAKDFWTPELGSTAFSRQQTQRISDRLAPIQAQRDSKWHRASL
jgi:hypothetical protein